MTKDATEITPHRKIIGLYADVDKKNNDQEFLFGGRSPDAAPHEVHKSSTSRSASQFFGTAYVGTPVSFCVYMDNELKIGQSCLRKSCDSL